MFRKYRKKIIIFICLIIILIIDIFLYFRDNKKIYTFYNFNNNIDYHVYLKDNKFFSDEYLKSDKQYISSLINYINVSFDFFGNYSNEINGQFYYTVKSKVKITDNDSGKSVFTYNEELFKSDTFKIDNCRFLQSDDNVNVDFVKYNNIVKSFLEEYDLTDFSSYLNIEVKLFVKGNNNYEDEFNMELEIPLNKKSFGIETITSDFKNDNNYFFNVLVGKYNYLYFIIFILSIMLIIVLLWKSFKDILFYYLEKIKNKNHKTCEINIILKRYGDFINEIDDFDFNNYCLVSLKNFEALIEIKDTLCKPLLMIKDYCIFVISENNLIYIYYVKA